MSRNLKIDIVSKEDSNNNTKQNTLCTKYTSTASVYKNLPVNKRLFFIVVNQLKWYRMTQKLNSRIVRSKLQLSHLYQLKLPKSVIIKKKLYQNKMKTCKIKC